MKLDFYRICTGQVSAFSIILIVATSTAHAEPYRLGVGDQISLDHNGIDSPLELTIDADGEVRLSNVGGVAVSGLTMDEAEAKLEDEMERDGFFVNPLVSLNIREYAPVVVGGDVINPGRFPYVPGMTVASALAMSGGGQVSGLTRSEIARARAEVQAGLRTENLGIAIAVSRLARFQAELAGPDAALIIDPDLESRIPAPQSADLDGFVRTETRVLDSRREQTRELLAFWENEIEAIEAQRQNFDARIAVQQQIVESATENLEAARELSERGLQTSANLATAEQRDADARSRVLEIEAAKIAAARAISTAQRERVAFLAKQEQDALAGIQATTQDLETAHFRYQRFQEQLALLTGGNAGALLDLDTLTLTFVLQSSRIQRPPNSEVSLETLVLPGETLIVGVSAGLDDTDG